MTTWNVGAFEGDRSSGVMTTHEALDYLHAYQSGLTADTGSAQSGATPLIAGINEISTVGTSGDSVALPSAQGGQIVIIINNGANSCDVFPFSGDYIDGGTVDVAVALTAGSKILYASYDSDNWESI